MFDVKVRFLDGGCESITVAPNSYVADLRSAVRERRGLSKFHEVKLIQGTEELKDDGYLEVRMPVRAMATVRLNLVGSGAALEEVLQPQEHWSGSRFWGVVLDEVAPLSGAEQERPIQVEVQATIASPFSNIVAALRDGSDEDEVAAVAALQEMPCLDAEQALILMEAARSGSWRGHQERWDEVGQAVARLCDDLSPLLPRFLEALSEDAADFDEIIVAAAALSTAASGAPNEKLQLQDHEAELVRSWASRAIFEGKAGQRKLRSAIVLLGATGSADCMARLQNHSTSWRSSRWAPRAPQLFEALDTAQRLFEAREQQRQQQPQAAPRAAPGGSMDEPPTTDVSGAAAGSPSAERVPQPDQDDDAEQSAESEEEARDLAQALHQSSLEKENADLQTALHLDHQVTLQRELLDTKSHRLSQETTAAKIETSVRALKLTRFARTAGLVEVMETSELLAPFRSDVEEAGCELRPAWANGAWLFVPIMDPEDLPSGIELNEFYILVRNEDAARIATILQQALRALPKARRPKVAEGASSAALVAASHVSEAGDDGSSGFVEEATFLVYARRSLRTASSADERNAHSEPCPKRDRDLDV